MLPNALRVAFCLAGPLSLGQNLNQIKTPRVFLQTRIEERHIEELQEKSYFCSLLAAVQSNGVSASVKTLHLT